MDRRCVHRRRLPLELEVCLGASLDGWRTLGFRLTCGITEDFYLLTQF